MKNMFLSLPSLYYIILESIFSFHVLIYLCSFSENVVHVHVSWPFQSLECRGAAVEVSENVSTVTAIKNTEGMLVEFTPQKHPCGEALVSFTFVLAPIDFICFTFDISVPLY